MALAVQLALEGFGAVLVEFEVADAAVRMEVAMVASSVGVAVVAA